MFKKKTTELSQSCHHGKLNLTPFIMSFKKRELNEKKSKVYMV